ncbi:MAG: hypothetical protein HFE04_01455 [Bacilli bacterium]|nr:hypothetical protein [Bacilli bacterium]
MQVKVVEKIERKIKNELQKEIIKTMKEFKKSLKTNDNNARLKFIKLLRLGIGLSNDVPYRKDFEEAKFNFIFEKSIELFLTSKEELDMENLSKILKMIGKVQSTHIKRSFINMNLSLIARSNIELKDVPNYYTGKLARVRKLERK